VIFIEGGDSFLLRRRPYDRTFKREEYSPDPSEPSRSTVARFLDWHDSLDDRSKAWQERLGQRFDAWEREWHKRRAARRAAKQAMRTQPADDGQKPG
jgi:hypothetical protein